MRRVVIISLHQIQEDQSSNGVTTVTAASRGIIQRDFQKSATFFKGYSASNPFGFRAQTEIEEYMKEIQNKKTPLLKENGQHLSLLA